MKLQPLHDQVLIKRTETANKTASGIIIPGGSGDKPDEGTVVGVGPGRQLDNGTISIMSVKMGDKVLFEKYGGVEINVGSEELLVVRDEKILGILK